MSSSAAADQQDHQLWVSLSALGDGNVFAVLPQLVKQMLSEGDMADADPEDAFKDVILPSDEAWQTKIYYKLVEKQRMGGDGRTGSAEIAMLETIEENVKLHEWNTIPRAKLESCLTVTEPDDSFEKVKTRTITWTVSDIAKAGCLLSSPPIQTQFEDEQEMRTVYTLIYDVFRSPLGHPHIWLLFYDLYHRSFKKRETKVASTAGRLFDRYGLSFPENALWTQRVKLAAAVARLRIQHSALTLGELLPPHLKDERVTEQAKNNPVTCWVNSTKVSEVKALCEEIEHAFDLKMSLDAKKVQRSTFKWDKHCPQIIAFHASLRSALAKSEFVKNHVLIVQDKSFCLGPATFGRLIDQLELTGSVIQTHVNSPRTTAYLATLLSHNDKIKNLLAFSAGKRKKEYETYFHNLGMTNITIFSDRLIDTPADATYMEEVVAVFATPPNSYSAVVDPIDLVCSRGGDLSMLEVLTESGDTKEARERIVSVLDEQKKTLKFAMSRPQIQFVLYETHSELEIENDCMVQRALNEINRIAKLQHASLQGKLLTNTSQESAALKEINNNEKMSDIDSDGPSLPKLNFEDEGDSDEDDDEIDIREKMLANIKVPDTDIFHVPSLPRLCNGERCRDFQKEGCYLALLQRKEIIRLDDKYMIKMAENRGLFGSNTTAASVKSKSSRAGRKAKQEKEQRPERPRKKLKEAEIGRIAAPTHTFLRHTKEVEEVQKCKKLEPEEEKPTVYRRWWKQTARHILSMRRSFIRQKILTRTKNRHSDVTAVVNSFRHTAQRVDELAKDNHVNTRYPAFPRLRLNRNAASEKVQIPLAVTSTGSDFPCILSTCYEVEEENEKENEPDENSLDICEHCVYRDVGMVAKSMVSKNILAKLSSAHIRKFISPYYKPPDMPFIREKRPLYTVQKTKKARTGSPSISSRSDSTKSKRNKIIDSVVKRLTVPTQSVILRTLKEVQENGKKLSAFEYTKRVYHCEECKKRNMDNCRA